MGYNCDRALYFDGVPGSAMCPGPKGEKGPLRAVEEGLLHGCEDRDARRECVGVRVVRGDEYQVGQDIPGGVEGVECEEVGDTAPSG
jgi:hypothetical protein